MFKFLAFAVFLTFWTSSKAFVCESDGFYPNPDDCAKFYRCVSGTVFSFDCGPGTHFNPSHNGCDWPYNVDCQASKSEQPSRYQQQSGQSGYSQQYGQSGQTYGQTGQTYGQSGQTLGQSGQQDYNQLYGQSGQSYQQLGQDYSQQYGQQPTGQTYSQQYGQQPTGQQSGQTYPQYGQQPGYDYNQQIGQIYGQQPTPQSVQSQYGQQPTQSPYGEYGSYSPQSGHRQHRHQNQRLPEESQQIDTRTRGPEGEDSVPQQKPNRRVQQRTYPKTDRRDEATDDLDTPYEPSENVRPKPRPRPQPKTNRRDEETTDDLDTPYEPPKNVRPKPRPRPQPKNSRRDENNLNEENDDFDYKFDERIDDRRPKPTQRRRQPDSQRKSDRRQPQPEESEEDSDEEWEITTTKRPRVPKRKYRISTTTPVTTTEENDSNEDEDQFSQFENEVKNKDDDESKDGETNKWLTYEDITTTTTEDPFVSMLNSRVPPQPRNRTRIDKNRSFGRRYGSTTSTTTPSERTSTTTVDPFDKDWADFISGKDNGNANQRTENLRSNDENKQKKKPQKTEDPLLMPNVISYLNCTEAGKSCEVCEELDWIKYSGVGLQSTPFRSFKFLKNILTKQCYKACSESQQCVAFSYSNSTGMCHIYDQLAVNDIQTNEGFNTVVKNPKNIVINDEWIHTKNGLISGNELYSVKSDNVWDCLHECVKDLENCKAIDFDLVETNCRVFDAYEGFTVDKLKANSISFQNLAIFDDNNKWRFEDLGHKTLANSKPIQTMRVQEPEECFYECIENRDNNCSFVTIQENRQSADDEENEDESKNSGKLCHLFAYNSTPKWIKSRDRTNTSYAMDVPKNHSRIQEHSGYTYVGNPIEIKEGLTEEECREYAEENCPFCRKYTSIVETKECALFSDSALLSPAIKETNYTERSALISMPKDYEYMAFKRIPWKTFTSDLSPYELKGEINGQKCVQFCLQQKLCVAAALVYDTTESSMFCYFFKESDLNNSKVTEYENVDLFVKLLDENQMPGHMSNKTDDCSDGEPLDTAVKNVNDLNANLDYSSQRSSTDRDRYNTNSFPLSPHGYDYSGGPNEEDSDRNTRKQNIRNSRSVDNRNQRLRTDENDLQTENENKRRTNELKNIENALEFIESVKENARKKSILDQIPSIANELRKRVKTNKLETKSDSKTASKSGDEEEEPKNPKTRAQKPKQRTQRPESDEPKGKSVDRLSEECNDNENEFDFESNRCKNDGQTRNESEMCSELPKIIYSDPKQMQSCNETVVGEECQVICRSGYEPTVQQIKCEKSGNRNVWKNSKQIKCKPIETECETVNRKEDNIRIRSTTQYPEERLHFITNYDSKRKLPKFSAYVHTKENNLNKTSESSDDMSSKYIKNSCELLDEKQRKVSDYKQTDYNLRPLLSSNAFLYSNEAKSLLNTMTNIIPQDPFTSNGPWSTLNNRTLEMLKTRPGIVISGVCPESIPKPDGRQTRNRNNTEESVEIPKCFWSIVCVPYDNGVTSAAFYSENTHPMSQLEKQSRVEQIREYRDQRFIVRLLGTETYRNVWFETYNAFKDLNKGIKSFIFKCAETQKNTPEGIAFWDNVVNNGENVEEWQTKFRYGLEKSDLKSKTRTDSEDDGQQRRASGKRRERDDQNIDEESM